MATDSSADVTSSLFTSLLLTIWSGEHTSSNMISAALSHVCGDGDWSSDTTTGKTERPLMSL